MAYKEFLIVDLFDHYSKTKNKTNFEKQKEKTKFFNLPASSSTTTNNGLGYYVKKEDHNPLKNMLTVASNGKAGKMFYQTNDFAIAQDSYALKLKENDSVNVYLYIKTLMEKLIIPKYDWTLKATWNRIKKHKIKLPVKDNGNIDFNYIENFMQNIKEKVILNLEEKTEKEINILTEKLNINIKEPLPEYKEPEQVKPFKVGVLFDQYSNTKNKPKFEKQKEKTNIFNLPATSSTTTNNGLGYYVKKEDHNPLKRMLTLASNGNAGKMFYQTNEFAIAQDSYALKLKETDSLEVHLYIKTILEKKILPLYDRSYKATWNKVKKEIIYLPAKEDGSPNYQYMLETGGALLLRQ